MQKHNNIKALFFLGIFSMFLLHQVIPHLHHQHEVKNTHESTHNDNHSHEHDSPQKESSEKGFLDLFLEMHTHTIVYTEVLLTQQRSVKQLDVKKDVIKSFSVNHFSFIANYDEVEKIKVYQPPNNYFNAHLSSLDARGPPSLG